MRKKRSATVIKTETLIHRVIQARNLLYRYGVDPYHDVSHVGLATSPAARIKAVELFNSLSDSFNEMDHGVDAKLRLLILFVLIGKLKYSASPDMKSYRDWHNHEATMKNAIKDPSTDMAHLHQNIMAFEAILDTRDINARIQQLMLLKLSL